MRRADPLVPAAALRVRDHRRHHRAVRARAAAGRVQRPIRAERQGLARPPALTANRQNVAGTAVLRRRTEATGRARDPLRRVPDQLPAQGRRVPVHGLKTPVQI